jgi:hypothetical protein
MATVVHQHLEVPLEGFRISWGGIWAGVLTVMGTLLFLTTLGLAVGISVIDPGTTDGGALGTGAAIWTAASMLIALFVGGMAATRLGMVFDKAAGAFEGALVWVLSFLVILWLASAGIRLVAGGVFSVFGGVGQTVASAATASNDLSSGNVEQILQRLRDPQTASTVSAATGIPQAEVRSTLEGLTQRVEAARNDPEQVASEVRQGLEQMMARARAQLPAVAQRAQEGASTAAWSALGAMVLSLIAAVVGAMLGRRQAARRVRAHATT